MPVTFNIESTITVNAPATAVWNAVTQQTAGWLWPSSYEPRVGGAAGPGVVTVWDPPRAVESRMDGPDGFFNVLGQTITEVTGETARVDYHHQGVLRSDQDSELRAIEAHTEFYLNALAMYVQHFDGCSARYVSVDGPARTAEPDALGASLKRLGIGLPIGVGERVSLAAINLDEAVIDYATENFVGLRTESLMLRLFARSAWSGPLSVSVHIMDPLVDADEVAGYVKAWLADF